MNEIIVIKGDLKAGDINNNVIIELKNDDREKVNEITYLRIYKTVTKKIDIHKYIIIDGIIHFKLPNITPGTYYLEAMDEWGRIYPPRNTGKITVNEKMVTKPPENEDLPDNNECCKIALELEENGDLYYYYI